MYTLELSWADSLTGKPVNWSSRHEWSRETVLEAATVGIIWTYREYYSKKAELLAHIMAANMTLGKIENLGTPERESQEAAILARVIETED